MRRGRRGAALVELALTMPLLMLILLGIVEFGMILHTRVMLAEGVREGARAAAHGRPVAEVVAALRTPLPGGSTASVLAEFDSPTAGSRVNLTDTPDGKANAAPSGAKIHVMIQGYRHQMVTGSFFSWLPGYDRGTIPLTAGLAVRRR